ncbi:MAG: hypothetical protein Alpg2KO_27260 [Alphaproteobacteria bacterium]
MARFRPNKRNTWRKRLLIRSSALALAVGSAGTIAATKGVETLTRDARVLAASHDVPGYATNAIEHAHASARMTQMFGPRIARFLGIAREVQGAITKGDEVDAWRDEYNNSIGRQIALYAEETGLGIDDLVIRAWQDGQLIDRPHKDDRVQLDTRPEPDYIPPRRTAFRQEFRTHPYLVMVGNHTAQDGQMTGQLSSAQAMFEQLRGDAHDFARDHQIPRRDWNAIEHAHVSIQLTQWLGPQLAKTFGDAREQRDAHLRDPKATWRDKYNNAIGRAIALHARSTGSDAEALLAKAWQDGQLITSLEDDRITLSEDPDPTYKAPDTPPKPARKPI